MAFSAVSTAITKTALAKEATETPEKKSPIGEKNELPTAIIIRDVPRELFEDSEQKANFTSMFQQITPDPVRLDFLKSFQRVRVIFEKPEHATAAKLLVEHHSFNGMKMKAFFAKNIKMTRKAYQDEAGHLTLPPLEKQFLISPPSSPPVGWKYARRHREAISPFKKSNSKQTHVQHAEMAPVVCDFDLMSRLAALTVDDKYELFEGDEQQRRPSIVVTPCTGETKAGGGLGDGLMTGKTARAASPGNDSDHSSDSELPVRPKIPLPHTPRPPKDD